MRFGFYYSLFLALFLASCATNTPTAAVAQTSIRRNDLIGFADGPGSSAKSGAYLDSQEQKNLRSSPRTLQRMERGEPLTIDDIIKLHDGSVRDQTVIEYIQDSGATYSLTETQMRRLRSAGISRDVIVTMRRGEG